MELEAINNNIKYGYIYIIQIMNYIYIGSGENANNKNRLETHLYELFNKLKKGEPLTRKLFKAIEDFILNISIFYDIKHMSFHDFYEAIRLNPNLYFTIIKDNVPYTTLKELKMEEQSSIDEYNSINGPCGLNCIRAYRFAELTYDYKKESDMKLIQTNPINRVFRLFISNNKNKLSYANIIPFQPIQYNKETKHSLKTNQMNMIINKIESDWQMYVNVFLIFLIVKGNSIYYGNKIITDSSINTYIESLKNTNHQHLVNVCYNWFKKQ